jgi:hypothetical protein
LIVADSNATTAVGETSDQKLTESQMLQGVDDVELRGVSTR